MYIFFSHKWAGGVVPDETLHLLEILSMMQRILLLGAGRSATVLIRYLLDEGLKSGFTLTVADADKAMAEQKVGQHPAGRAAALNAMEAGRRQELIREHDVVISLLPPSLHVEVARDCLMIGRHLVTASYVPVEIASMHQEAQQRGIVLMNELGLDPGIDHMSAMERIHQIQAAGGRLTGFYSSTGGLVAPQSDDNPWHYKFSWNPRNVVLAGQGTAQFLEGGQRRYLPYHRLFKQTREIEVPGMGTWEVYANRDALPYQKAYGLEDVQTLFRGTIRHKGFCRAWDALITLGLTDPVFQIDHEANLTFSELIEAFLGHSGGSGSLRARTAALLGEDADSTVMDQLEWLGLFSERTINPSLKTPAQILEDLLLERWFLKPEDRDMVIMQHIFQYQLEGDARQLRSTLVMQGADSTRTAMSTLVGLPLGVFVKQFLLGQIKLEGGVHIPTAPAVYKPVMDELAGYGVTFTEEYV